MKRRDGVERLQERCLRWVLGVEKSVPGYMVREELAKRQSRGERAWGYGNKLEEGEEEN